LNYLLAVQAHIPQTSAWSWNVSLVMIFCNLFAIAIGRFAIQHAGEANMPLPGQLPALWKRFGVPELLATLSFGHLLGAGMILGLSNAGVL